MIIYLPDTASFGRPYVNMDPEVLGLLREIECLDKLQCPIPDTAQEFLFRAPALKKDYEYLKVGLFDGDQPRLSPRVIVIGELNMSALYAYF